MNFGASNCNKHKKIHLVIIETQKNYLIHNTLCPISEKMFEQIQNLKLQWICRYVFDEKWTLQLLTMISTKKDNQ